MSDLENLKRITGSIVASAGGLAEVGDGQVPGAAPRPPDAVLTPADVAMLDEMNARASEMRRHYEGELLRETMRAVAWRARCDRQWAHLLVFVGLTLALAVALIAAVYFAPEIAAWRAS